MKIKLAAGLGFMMLMCMSCVAQSSYSVVELKLGANRTHVVHRINLRGGSVGAVGNVDGSGTEAFLADSTGAVKKLGWTKRGDYSEATAMNRAEVVVGYMNTAVNMRAFRWDGGALQDLGTLPGDNSSKAFAVNERGQIVGYSSGPTGVHAFVWSAGSGMQNVVPSAAWSEANSIANNGAITGKLRSAGHDRAYFKPSNGPVAEIGPLPGDTDSNALSLSENAQFVVGTSGTGEVMHAFKWSPGIGLRQLQELSADGPGNTQAFDVNNSGVAVGTSVTDVAARAVVWDANGKPTDLNDVLPPNADLMLTQALAVNENGWILAVGGPMRIIKGKADMDDEHHSGAVHSYLLIRRD